MIKKKCYLCFSGTKKVMEGLTDDRYGAPGNYAIYKCFKCGFVRTDPVLEKKKIGSFYAKYYPLNRLTPTQIKKQVNTRGKFISWLDGVGNVAHWYVKKGSDVLDIGSGSGVSLLEIKKLGANAFGIEPDPSSKKFAKALGLNVYNGFISDDPFPKKKFDYVTASQVIEHEPDPLKFLVAAKKKLKKGGEIILSFPNVNSLYRFVFNKSWIHWHVPYHINHFSKDSFLKLSEKSGLKVVKIKTVTPNLWTVLQIRSLFVKPKVGKTSSVWASARDKRAKNKGWQSMFFGLLIKSLAVVVQIVVTPVNRLIDFLNIGESFVVWLEKK